MRHQKERGGLPAQRPSIHPRVKKTRKVDPTDLKAKRRIL